MRFIKVLFIRKSLIFFFFLSCSFSCAKTSSPVPSQSRQMILVLTDSIPSSKGSLFMFEREGKKNSWAEVGEKIPVALGKRGLAWGRGLHKADLSLMPAKKEGDKKSPAGVFTLSLAFGRASKDSMKNLKITYVPITDMLECIDDSCSKYYNEMTLRNGVAEIDWKSSEKMIRYGKWYDQGVVVDNNLNPRIKGAGSCVFLHNWVDPDETTAGCVEMNPEHLKWIIHRLNSAMMPVIVLLPKQVYNIYRSSWGLPRI